ncbi:MAG: ATP-dependent Clp protease adaptor protein ClpS [bacterium]|jgi:ATP-dependent Clp protease adaptor protein ClpS
MPKVFGNEPVDQLTEKSKDKVKQPRMYNVILHNDDYTPMEFVVDVITDVFHRNPAEATQLMLGIHNNGKAICGTYSYEVAEMKVAQVHRKADPHEYPLKSTLEAV